MTDRNQDGIAPFWADMTIRPITDQEFALFQALIHREAGINIGPAKKALLVGRLTRRLKDLGLKSFGEYYRRVKGGDEEERVNLLDAISTNETHFFREPRHFEFLERHVFPEWMTCAASGLKARRIRAWSAGCSTGEEPYSLAMILLDHFSTWGIEILATDLSTRVLERARAAVWSLEKAQEIPMKYLKAYMLRGVQSQEGKMKAGAEICSIVRFERLNLNDEVYPVTGLFDLIFCRNVLIYFETETKKRIIDRLLKYLAPGGYFFVGHAESLSGLTDWVRSVTPTVYVHAEQKKSGAIWEKREVMP